MARSKNQADQVNHQPFVVWDFLLTLLVQGVPAPEGIDDSILPALGGKQWSTHFSVGISCRGLSRLSAWVALKAVRHGLDQAG